MKDISKQLVDSDHVILQGGTNRSKYLSPNYKPQSHASSNGGAQRSKHLPNHQDAQQSSDPNNASTLLAYFESHPEVDVDAVIHDNVDAGEHDKDVMVCTAATRNYAINMQDVNKMLFLHYVR